MHEQHVSTVSPVLRWALTAALSSVVYMGFREVQARHRRRLAAKVQALPEKLQVWEEEGGQNPMP